MSTGGLVGYWRLGEASGTNANDLSLPGNDGSYVAGTTLGQTGALTGDTDTAASFDGVDDHVSVADSSSLDLTTKLTVEAWLKKTAFAEHRHYVVKENVGGDATGTWQLSVLTDGKVRLERNNVDTATSTGAVTVGAWHHVVVVFDDAANPKVRFYIDGRAAGTSNSVAGPFTANNETLLIGRRGLTTVSWWDGLLDEVAIYDTALTTPQIEAHYTEGTGG